MWWVIWCRIGAFVGGVASGTTIKSGGTEVVSSGGTDAIAGASVIPTS
jgi:hypothetical protein